MLQPGCSDGLLQPGARERLSPIPRALHLRLLIRRCHQVQVLDVKGSHLSLSGGLFSPRPPSGQPRTALCGAIHMPELPMGSAGARTPAPR